MRSETPPAAHRVDLRVVGSEEQRVLAPEQLHFAEQVDFPAVQIVDVLEAVSIGRVGESMLIDR